jgi:hypothetical protein
MPQAPASVIVPELLMPPEKVVTLGLSTRSPFEIVPPLVMPPVSVGPVILTPLVIVL